VKSEKKGRGRSASRWTSKKKEVLKKPQELSKKRTRKSLLQSHVSGTHPPLLKKEKKGPCFRNKSATNKKKETVRHSLKRMPLKKKRVDFNSLLEGKVKKRGREKKKSKFIFAITGTHESKKGNGGCHQNRTRKRFHEEGGEGVMYDVGATRPTSGGRKGRVSEGCGIVKKQKLVGKRDRSCESVYA